jgi:hypothetical protein
MFIIRERERGKPLSVMSVIRLIVSNRVLSLVKVIFKRKDISLSVKDDKYRAK